MSHLWLQFKQKSLVLGIIDSTFILGSGKGFDGIVGVPERHQHELGPGHHARGVKPRPLGCL
jgi:hypothetical protein